jgi:hypothetical protein
MNPNREKALFTSGRTRHFVAHLIEVGPFFDEVSDEVRD